MHLSDHSLRQIDDDYVRSLGTDELRGLSLRLLADLKEARERLNQGPTNSSRPPSSRSPWERGQFSDPTHEPEAPQDEAESAEAPLIEAQPTANTAHVANRVRATGG
jgi:transposase